MRLRARLVPAVAVLLGACGGTHERSASAPTPAAPAVHAAVPAAEPASSPSPQPLGAASCASADVATVPLPPAHRELVPLDVPFARLFETASEKDAYYFSHNYVSNESSYLQVAPGLHKYAKEGGAYIGVGPEQNFTYVAMVRPDIAFVVDIRRRNALVHLIYKVLFEQAESRSHLLAMLLGRPYEAASAPPADAGIDAILAHATKLPRSRDTLRDVEARVLERVEQGYGIKLDWADRLAIKESLKAFFDDQLDIKFQLYVKSKEHYPTLRELMIAADPKGVQESYLANEEYFRFVQQMHRQNRIVPVVGNFAGDHALLAIAAYVKEQKVPVTTFYVSNVEEYLLQDNLWAKWVRNIDALPIAEDSLFIRSHLARGDRDHPLRMQGHRTTTLLQRMQDFKTRQQARSFTEWQDVATHAVLPEPR